MRFKLVGAILVCVIHLKLGCADTLGTVALQIPGVGLVTGDWQLDVRGNYYLRYRAIQYAYIEEKGWFQPAFPQPAFYRIVNDKYTYGPSCPELENAFDGVNECLILTIDSSERTEKKPVIVYLPGYDLMSGNILSKHGSALMTKDVVLVTVQYRVGAFGFLSTLTDDIPGNIGVLDVIEALKWIQKHISHFGGDPNRVTLNGQYLAAGMIGVLTASPLAEGLFHQVIYQTGSFELEELKTHQPLKVAKRVGLEANCTDVEDVAKLTKCLVDASPWTILSAYNATWHYFGGVVNPITIGGPSGVINSDHKFRQYPTMGGFVDHPTVHIFERMGFEENMLSKVYVEQEFSDLLSIAKSSTSDSSKVVTYYYGDDDFIAIKLNVSLPLLDEIVQSYLPILIDMSGLEIKLGVLRALIDNKKLGGRSYMFIFRYKCDRHYFKPKPDTILKNYVTLGDDFPYLYSHWNDECDGNSHVAEVMVDLWTTFAATGVPSSPKLNEWPELESDTGPFLIIDAPNRDYIGYNLTKEVAPTINCRKTKGCEWRKL